MPVTIEPPAHPADSSTSATLLHRIRNSKDGSAWHEFAVRYWRLVYWFARSSGLGEEDSEDIVQEVFSEIARSIASFEYDAERGRFRGLLRTMTQRRVIDRLRRNGSMKALAEGTGHSHTVSALEEFWEKEELRAELAHAMEMVRREVAPVTYQAFQLYVLEGWTVRRVSVFLGISTASVYTSKSRVLARVREILHNEQGGA